MRDRCLREKCTTFKHYGGRGITICERWASFTAFLIDMGPCPPGYTIERRDYDGNYEPSNCYWLPKTDQSGNRRTCTFVEVKGERMHVAKAARLHGIPHWTFRRRLQAGWSADDIVTVLGHGATR